MWGGIYRCRRNPIQQLRTSNEEFPARNLGFPNPTRLAFSSLRRLVLYDRLRPASHCECIRAEKAWITLISLLPGLLSCSVKSENGTCSQSKTFQMSQEPLKCKRSEFFKGTFDLMGLLDPILYKHRPRWHLPPKSLFKISSSSFGLAFELGLISHVDQETLSEKKTLFFQKVSLRSSEIWVFHFVLVLFWKGITVPITIQVWLLLNLCFLRFLNLITVDTQCYIHFWCDSTSLYVMLCSPREYLPSVTVQHYYDTVGCISRAVPCIPMTYSLHHWKLGPPSPLYPFFPSPTTPVETISLFSIFIGLILHFVY